MTVRLHREDRSWRAAVSKGGITASNAQEYIDKGAAKVIVTSFVFKDGVIDFERLQQLKDTLGPEKVVIDLSCRKKASTAEADGDEAPDRYFVVTNKWTKYTDFTVTWVKDAIVTFIMMLLF